MALPAPPMSIPDSFDVASRTAPQVQAASVESAGRVCGTVSLRSQPPHCNDRPCYYRHFWRRASIASLVNVEQLPCTNHNMCAHACAHAEHAAAPSTITHSPQDRLENEWPLETAAVSWAAWHSVRTASHVHGGAPRTAPPTPTLGVNAHNPPTHGTRSYQTRRRVLHNKKPLFSWQHQSAMPGRRRRPQLH